MISEKKGIVVMLLSAAMFAVGNLFLKLVTGYLPAVESALVRSLFGILVVLILFKCGLADLSTHNKKMLVVRGMLGGTSMTLIFMAIGMGPLTNATVLHNTSPIFAMIFGAMILKERITWRSLLPLAASLVGIYLLVHPDFQYIRPSDLMALAAGVISGLAAVIIRELRRTESAYSIFFSFSVFGAIFSGVLAAPVFVIPTWLGWGLMLAAAVFATLGQILMTWGYKFCTAAEGSILAMTMAPMTVLLGIGLLGERLTFTEGVGVILVLSGSTLVSVLSASREKKLGKTDAA